MNHKILPVVVFILVMFCTNFLGAQQSPRFIQYLYNESAFNPAMAGVKGTEAFLLHRQEWTGLNDGIFSSQVLGGSIRPFGALQKVGVGAMFMLDQAHIIQTGQYGLTFAYQLMDGTLTPHKLSVGLLGGVINKRFNFQDAQINSPNDAFLFDEAVNEMGFNFGMGASYSGPLGPGNLTINVASTQSNLNFNVEDPDGDFILGLKRNIIASARFNYPLNDDIAIEPALLFKTLLLNSDLKEDLVVGVRGNYKDMAYAGLVYSTASGSLGLVVGVNLGKGKAGGAFEMPIGSSGDLGLTYELGIQYLPGIKPIKEPDTTVIESDSLQIEPEIEPEIEQPEEEKVKPSKKEEKKEKDKKEEKPEEPVNLLNVNELIRKYNESDAKVLKTRIRLNALPGPDGTLHILSYNYTDLYAGYNNIPPVEKLVAHLQQTLSELETQGFDIAGISVTTNSSESDNILQRPTGATYQGEFGDITDVNYQLNGQNIQVSIPNDQSLTIQQVEYLKLYRLSEAFSSYASKIDMRLNTGRPVFETTVEIILK